MNNKKKVYFNFTAKDPKTNKELDFFMLVDKEAIDKIPEENIKSDLGKMMQQISINPTMEIHKLNMIYSFSEKPAIPKLGNTMIEVAIPYCLHLPNGEELDIVVDNKNTATVVAQKIWTNNVQDSSIVDVFSDEKSTWFMKSSIITPIFPHKPETGCELQYTGKNIQKIRDNTGKYRYTNLKIFFNTNYTKNELDSKKILDTVHPEIAEIAQNIVNKILDCYRYVTKEDFIEKLAFINILDIYFFKENIGYYPVLPNVEGARMNRSEVEINSIREMLGTDNKPPVFELLRLNAQSSFERRAYVLSVVESFQALEIFLENYLIRILKKKGLSKEEIKERLRKIWRTKERLRDLLKEATDRSLLEDKTLWDSWCTMYDKVRSEVVHYGKEPSTKEAFDVIDCNNKVIKWIENIKVK